MVSDCLFCRVVAGELGTAFVAEDDLAVAFEDIAPVAPVHVLVVSRAHVPTVGELSAGPPGLGGALLALAVRVAAERGLDEGGYRLVVNSGSDGGQTVGHLHLHVLGGRPMSWPPG